MYLHHLVTLCKTCVRALDTILAPPSCAVCCTFLTSAHYICDQCVRDSVLVACIHGCMWYTCTLPTDTRASRALRLSDILRTYGITCQHVLIYTCSYERYERVAQYIREHCSGVLSIRHHQSENLSSMPQECEQPSLIIVYNDEYQAVQDVMNALGSGTSTACTVLSLSI